ncbi:ABC transporter ATP-binding protein [Streptodolium elevatio]|uniref:ATP-binding cassette domain-containing protein n=1 Tax=Streptodolium elevatio TaxID=3157996 RepID=A0ABV3DCH5_9ACTN
MTSKLVPVVSVVDLRVGVADRLLVDGLSFDLHRGRVLALVGPSGSGKTTGAAAILGEFPARSVVGGTVTVDGKAVSAREPVPPGPVAYVPQHPAGALAPALRIGPVLREIARRHLPAAELGRRERRVLVRAAVASALRQVGLPDDGSLHRRFPHQLSGGQQQRIVIAHALLARARVVVADEPTTGLDAVLRREVADRIRVLADDGMAVLLLSHDLDVVRRVADDVLVLDRGRQVEYGTAEAVLGRPSAPLTRALVAADCGRAARPAEAVTVRAADAATPRAAADAVAAQATEGPYGGLPDSSSRSVDGLVVSELSAWYGGRRRADALSDVSLRLTRGTSLAVVGRSGSGKTTLARCLVGLHRDQRGSVCLDGQPLTASAADRSRGELARVQYVFQDARASLDPRRSVLDQVARPAVRLRDADPRAAEDRAVRILAAMGVDEAIARRRPRALSGGELRRAALARALAADPDVLVCDEITAGLDPLARDAVLDLLDTQLRVRGLALLVITHERAVAARLADRIAVMDSGRIVDEGPAAELLDRPTHPLTAALLSADLAAAPAP